MEVAVPAASARCQRFTKSAQRWSPFFALAKI
jgi:hypothetical protein